jgi:ArsR family transcriptional regulator
LRDQNINRIFTINITKMGKVKKEGFSSAQNELARYAKALAHPARVAILLLLLKKRACICGSIVGELPLSQSTVSQHLKELKEAGLIKGDIDGAKVCYCIDQEGWNRAAAIMKPFLHQFESQETSKCCG